MPAVCNEKHHHLLIAGTGRSGTSVLVKLLNACGLETALTKADQKNSAWHHDAQAGAETHIYGDGRHPYVIKSPWTYQFIRQILDDDNIVIDEVIIPVRKLTDAAASRIVNELGAFRRAVPEIDRYDVPWSDVGLTAGGLVNSVEPIDQERILGRAFHILIETLEEKGVPYRIISYPRFVNEPDYAYDRLKHLFTHFARLQFDIVFGQIANPKLSRLEKERTAERRHDGSPLAALRLIEASRNLKVTVPCSDPDDAPDGMSYGDADLPIAGFAGWHWLTSHRDDRRFGIQVAMCDTGMCILFRQRIENAWQRWVQVPFAPT